MAHSVGEVRGRGLLLVLVLEVQQGGIAERLIDEGVRAVNVVSIQRRDARVLLRLAKQACRACAKRSGRAEAARRSPECRLVGLAKETTTERRLLSRLLLLLLLLLLILRRAEDPESTCRRLLLLLLLGLSRLRLPK